MTYFECALCLLVIENYFGNIVEGNGVTFCLFALSGVLILFSMNRSSYSRRELWGFGMLTLFSVISFVHTGEKLILEPLILYLGMKNVDLRHMIKVYGIISFVCGGIKILLGFSGCMNDVIVYRITRNGEIMPRHSYGFEHPNQLALWGIIVMAAFFYLNRNIGIWKSIFISISVGMVMYYVTGSRTAFVVFFIIIFVNSFWNNIETVFRRNNVMQKLSNYSVLIISLLAVGVTLAYRTQKAYTLNEMFSNRLYYWNKVLEESSVIGIENFAYFLENKKIVLDSTYIYIVGAYGFILAFLYILCSYIAIRGLLKKEMFREVVFVLIFLVYGLMETLINPIKNFSILFLLYALRNRNVEGKEKNEFGFNYYSNI